MKSMSCTFAPSTRDLPKNASTMTEAQRTWRYRGARLLSIRVIQGFIYWGGGSRRFIYAPSKLDPGASQLDGEQIPDGHAGRPVRHGPPHQLHADPLLAALCRRHPVQRRRTHRRPHADDGIPDPFRRARLDGLLRAADGDVRLARRHLHRRVDDGGLQSRHGRDPAARAAAAPIRSTTFSFSVIPRWRRKAGSAGRQEPVAPSARRASLAGLRCSPSSSSSTSPPTATIADRS